MTNFELEFRKEEADFKDLMQDFAFVKDLNTEMARRYTDLMSSFPTSAELDILIGLLNMASRNTAITVEAVSINEYDEATRVKRLTQLKRFRSALVMLEKQDIRVLPPKYESIDKPVDMDAEMAKETR